MDGAQVLIDPSERLPWPDDWFETTDSAQIRACRSLWCNVLLDCLRSVLQCGARSPSAPRQVDFGWIGTRDFHMVCALAGVDGEIVAARIRQMADAGETIPKLYLRARHAKSRKVAV